MATIITFPGLAARVASLSSMTDDEHASMPEEWRHLSALLYTLLEDEGMSAVDVARVLPLPEAVVAEFRHMVGI